MASIDLSDYKKLYIKTAHEYIGAILASIILIKTNMDNFDAIDTIYRSAHSLKSQSLLMGYRNTASLNEYIEHTFKNIKDGHLDLTDKVLGEIEIALQKIEKSVNSIETLNKELALQDGLVN